LAVFVVYLLEREQRSMAIGVLTDRALPNRSSRFHVAMTHEDGPVANPRLLVVGGSNDGRVALEAEGANRPLAAEEEAAPRRLLTT
jgi:hypothetical protein